MFEVENVVIHPSAGVCKIVDIRKEKFSGEEKDYYVLEPMGKTGKSTLFVPVDSSKIALKPLYTKEEIHQIMDDVKASTMDWIENANVRKNTFYSVLHGDDIGMILAMVVCLRENKERILKSKKKFATSDDRTLKEAEKKVVQEFAYSMNMNETEMIEYIKEYFQSVS